ncbi:unnamed protein product [Orchesella dallaii]|uniref:F-box domain-containing protein n=1 Tax=Orchesella dallaii TaxID=48710 RepID=A0ABP1R4R6_9HEXA
MSASFQLEKDIFQMLPAEVWTHVFRYLSNEDCFNTRLVSDYMCNIIDTMPPPPLNWVHCYPSNLRSPTTTSTFAEAMIMFRKTPATRFLCAKDVEKFQTEIEQRTPTDTDAPSPFKYSTLTIDWSSVHDFSALHTELPAFLQKYGHHVMKLLYFIHCSVPNCVKNLKQILGNMPNLKTITFFSTTWDGITIKVSYFAKFSDMVSLSELEVLGQHHVPFLVAFTTRFGSQIRRLHWGLRYVSEMAPKSLRVVAKCVNLQTIKISNWPTELGNSFLPPPFLVTSAVSIVPLKHFSIRVTPYELKHSGITDFSHLRHIFEIVNAFTITLETICLHVDPTGLKLPKDSSEITKLGSGLNFLKVQELSLLYAVVGHPFFKVCLQACPKLKYLIFLDTKQILKNINDKVNIDKLVEVSRRLWSLVNGTKVYKIFIQSCRFDEKIGKLLPYIFEVKMVLE